MTTLGLVTIGQAPRTDVHTDAAPLLTGIRLAEHGALDDDVFDGPADATAALAPDPGEAPLVTRLRDGGSVVLGHRALMPRLERAVARAEGDGAAATLLLCTGRFPAVRSARPLLFAETLFQRAASALVGEAPVGIVCPRADQAADVAARWSALLPGRVRALGATPYAPPAEALAGVASAAAELASAGAEWLVLDCVGYTEEMRSAAARAAGVPVLLARSMALRLAAEAVSAGAAARRGANG
ncbi:hypothetical protein BIV57_08575 [Mangrovactinospora gilvigrisea]|uniref:AroM family protein n=1 Tax=Mangrovactinospora gilvigrisea TaxID=1428644 RepID=A0A1J7BH50_9ACTN|nr:AroM family protein [Mangrovactinospora gilvigrisea]OIV37901.1 hypothetical protein BIV57_08575 [Mangrovactinospora gilvigrisea]